MADSPRKWTEAEIAKLMELHAQKVPYRDIAEILGRREKPVQMKIYWVKRIAREGKDARKPKKRTDSSRNTNTKVSDPGRMTAAARGSIPKRKADNPPQSNSNTKTEPARRRTPSIYYPKGPQGMQHKPTISEQDLDKSSLRYRGVQMFKFLHDAVKLRYKQKRQTLPAEEDALWLHELKHPLHENVHCPLLRPDGEVIDFWVEIRRPDRTAPPPPPPDLADWVDPLQLRESRRLPEPMARIIRESGEQDDDGNDEVKFIEWADEPGLQEAWENYLLESWMPWAEQDVLHLHVEDSYRKLYRLYQQWKRESEDKELILAAGCLQINHNDTTVKTHLIELRAILDFNPDRKTIWVRPASDSTEPELVHEAIPNEWHPDHTELQSAINDLSEAGVSLHYDSVHQALKSWAQCLPDQLLAIDKGYGENVQPRQLAGNDEAILLDWAPVFFIRPRQGKSLLRVYEDLKQQFLELDFEEEAIPQPLRRLLGEPLPHDEPEEGRQGLTELLFPLPANDEQRRVAKLVERRPVVVVQGPPGTGKSQTITNLICHLLANGKRVLVTSQTSRALRVLREKLDSVKGDIARLSVVLTDDADYRRQLEVSVGEIVTRFNQFDERSISQQVERLNKRLSELADIHARTFNDLLASRSRTTNKNQECFGYRGSFEQILQQIRHEDYELGWLDDQLNEENEPPLTEFELAELHRLYLLGPALSDVVENAFPEIDRLPQPDVLNAYFTRLAGAEKAVAEDEQAWSEHKTSRLAKLDDGELNDLRVEIERLVLKQQELDMLPWLAALLQDCFSGNRTVWDSRLESSQKHFHAINDAIDKGLPDVAGLPDAPLETIRANAELVVRRFTEKGSLGLGIFRPKPINLALELLASVTQQGLPLKSEQDYRQLVHFIETLQHEEKLNQLWAGYTGSPSGESEIRVAYFRKRVEDLQASLRFADDVKSSQKRYSNWITIDLQQVLKGPSALKSLLDQITAAENRRFLQIEKTKSNQWINHLEQVETGRKTPNAITFDLITALKERNVSEYTTLYRQLQSTLELRSKLLRRQELASQLAKHAPRFEAWLSEHGEEDSAEARVASFHRAWNRLRARQRALRLDDPATRDRLQKNLADAELEIGSILGRLAGTRAWHRALQTLTDEDIQNLKLWHHAIGKVGKGTGPNAAHWRREARKHLGECVSAVPAWIMPIHRVAETFSTRSRPFDVIVVDEASQAGVESIFLSRLAHTLLIVGDDKQISPTSFVKQKDLNALISAYLGNLKHRSLLDDPKVSLFKLADVISTRSNSMLREHFRCMPEIIEFSNKIIYKYGLIPLKQFGGIRLEPPVLAVHVPESRAGDKDQTTNPAEARALAEAVKRCMSDPQYRNKSMGVISLLGGGQAELIHRYLENTVGPEALEKYSLICGDAYAFQGDERDVMYLSMVSSPDRRGSARTSDSDRQRFNVAASRAREQMWLFHSIQPEDDSPNSIKRMLLEYCLAPTRGFIPFLDNMPVDELRRVVNDRNRGSKPPGQLSEWFHSWFEAEVALALLERSYRVQPQYEVGGYYIDIVVQGSQGMVAIECDGDYWHEGAEQEERDLRRQIQLEGAGFVFHRIRGSRWSDSPDSELAEVESFLQDHRIYPTGWDSEVQLEDQAGDPHATVGDHDGVSSSVQITNAEPENKADPSSYDQLGGAGGAVYDGSREQDSDDFPIIPGEDSPEHDRSPTLFEQDHGDPLPASVREHIDALPRYRKWEPAVRQSISSLKTEGLERWILEAIDVEGPVKGVRLIRRIKDFVDGPPQQVRNAIDKVMLRIIRRREILQEHETDEPLVLVNNFLRRKGTKVVRVRKRGARHLSEIPPSETKILIRRLRRISGMLDHLTKLAVAHAYKTDIHNADYNSLYSRALEMIDEEEI